MDRFLIFIYLLTLDYVIPIDVQLASDLYVKAGSKVWVNCSSDVAPAGNIAEFEVNGVTVDSIRLVGTECYSASLRVQCLFDKCHCSEDGKMYKLNIQSNVSGYVDVACSMKFNSDKTVFISKSVKIEFLDISGPTFITAERLPLISGTNVAFRCSVITSLTVDLVVECFNKTYVAAVQSEPSIVKLNFTKEIITSDNGGKCVCAVIYKSFKSSSFLILNITSPPLLNINEYSTCNKSSTVRLECSLSGELKSYGFYSWVHHINGVFIRYLKSSNIEKQSVITLKSCGHFDEGKYICRAWNEDKNNIYDSNKTTLMTVNYAPVITETNIYHHQVPALSVYYLSNIKADVIWLRFDVQLHNSSLYQIRVADCDMYVDVYGKRVVRSGYNSNLSLYNDLTGEYTVLIRNVYGEVKYTFIYKQNNNNFHLRTLLLVLTAVSVFIATIGLMAVLAKRRDQHAMLSSDPNSSSNSRRAIYYAAPGDETNVHVYNSPAIIMEDIQDDESSGHYMEIDDGSSGHYMEINDGYEDTEKVYTDIHQYNTTPHDYIDILP